jgi:ornithine cyclodeaminase/alanine dehydrogenase-like protein (mu-crystallin family)
MLLLTDKLVASLLDPTIAHTEVLKALKEKAHIRAGLSDPPSMFLRSDREDWFYHVKGAYLSAPALAGVRVAGYPGSKAASTRIDLLVLTDLRSAAPVAIVSTRSIVEIRVGAALAIAIEYLKSSSASVLALVGAGRLARATIRAIQAAIPFACIRLVSRSRDSATRFAHDMAADGIDGINIVESVEEACTGADVIVTLTAADEPLVYAEWCRPGNLLVTAGGSQECHESVVLRADKVFIDDWQQCTVLGDIAFLHKQGKIKQDDITGTLPDLIAGKTPGRSSDNERIVAVPQGLAVSDLALCSFVYREAVARGLGQSVEW